jgi:hypothetical protein
MQNKKLYYFLIQNIAKLFNIQSSSNCQEITYLHSTVFSIFSSFNTGLLPFYSTELYMSPEEMKCLDATGYAIGMVCSLWQSHKACITHAALMGICTSTLTNKRAVEYPNYKTHTAGAHYKSMWQLALPVQIYSNPCFSVPQFKILQNTQWAVTLPAQVLGSSYFVSGRADPHCLILPFTDRNTNCSTSSLPKWLASMGNSTGCYILIKSEGWGVSSSLNFYIS